MTYHDTGIEKPRTKGGRWFRLLALLVVALAVGMGVMYRDNLSSRLTSVLANADEDPIPVQELKREPFQLEVPAYGEIIGLETVPVSTPTTRAGGLKIAYLVPEGTFVGEGDLVIRYDSTDARLNLERQQNTLDANQERTKVTTGNQQTTEKTLAIDKRDAEEDYEYAMTVLPQDETIFSKWDIIEAKINAGFAKEKIGVLTNRGKVQKRISRSDQQILAIEKNKAQAEIAISEQTLNSLELKAPKAGLVVYRKTPMLKDPQVGDESWPGQVVLELVDLSALQARVYVLERDAASLTRDREVVIRLDSIPEREFHGKMRMVPALAQPLERNSPLKYFSCEASIYDAGVDLKRIRPGMALKARVVLEKYDSCFVVPSSAITMKGADPTVYVRQADKFVSRVVKVGASNHGQATILDGVKDREVVAMRNPYETRKLKLPDFSKGSTGGQGGPGGMGGPPGGGRMMIRIGG
jgi:HlyD family secretion protein